MGESRQKPVYREGDRAGPGGGYRVLRMLGAGGMGEVYEVERDGRRYAYKTLQFRHKHNAHVMERFRAEAAAGQEMLHPNIARVYESGLDEHGGYLVMELLEGESFHEALHGRSMPVEEILRIGIEVADALHALHLAKIVHRDVKPGNVFLTRDGRAVLLDLGAAKFERYGMNTTQSQGPIGTVLFMSPEHINPASMNVKQVDGRSDVYSLGHVLFYALSGQFAVLLGKEEGPSNATQISIWHIFNEPPSLKDAAPHLSPVVVKVIDKATRREPERRYASAGEFATTLRAARSYLQESEARERRRRFDEAEAADGTVRPHDAKPAPVGPRGTVRMPSAPDARRASAPDARAASGPRVVKGGTTPMDLGPPADVPSAIVRAADRAVAELDSAEKREIFEEELAQVRGAGPRPRQLSPVLPPEPPRRWTGPLVALIVAILVGGALFAGIAYAGWR